MLIRKAFKFELMPNGEQIRKMQQFCGCNRFVFNKALSWQNTQYKADNTFKFRYVSGENCKTQATFFCRQCGFTANADEVGAINILRAGRAQLACEVNGALMPSAAGTHRSELVSHY